MEVEEGEGEHAEEVRVTVVFLNTVRRVVGVGSFAEPNYLPGLAHFLEQFPCPLKSKNYPELWIFGGIRAETDRASFN